MCGCIVPKHPGGQRIDSPGELAYEKWTQGQAHFPQISNLWAGVSWRMHLATVRFGELGERLPCFWGRWPWWTCCQPLQKKAWENPPPFLGRMCWSEGISLTSANSQLDKSPGSEAGPAYLLLVCWHALFKLPLPCASVPLHASTKIQSQALPPAVNKDKVLIFTCIRLHPGTANPQQSSLLIYSPGLQQSLTLASHSRQASVFR